MAAVGERDAIHEMKLLLLDNDSLLRFPPADAPLPPPVAVAVEAAAAGMAFVHSEWAAKVWVTGVLVAGGLGFIGGRVSGV